MDCTRFEIYETYTKIIDLFIFWPISIRWKWRGLKFANIFSFRNDWYTFRFRLIVHITHIKIPEIIPRRITIKHYLTIFGFRGILQCADCNLRRSNLFVITGIISWKMKFALWCSLKFSEKHLLMGKHLVNHWVLIVIPANFSLTDCLHTLISLVWDSCHNHWYGRWWRWLQNW